MLHFKNRSLPGGIYSTRAGSVKYLARAEPLGVADGPAIGPFKSAALPSAARQKAPFPLGAA